MHASRLCSIGVAALLVSGTAHAQTAPATGVISTHAEADRRLPNTVSDVSVGIEVHARDVPGTSSLLSQRAQALLDYLRNAKVERLRTEQVGVDAETQEVRGQPDRITGYTGHATVSFRTTPDQMPVLLAGCLDHGANGLQQSGSSPREEEVAKALQELSAEAARKALEQATIVAKALGEHVVDIQQVDVGTPGGGGIQPLMAPAPAMAMRAMRPAAPIPTEAGEADVSVSVSMKIRIAAGS